MKFTFTFKGLDGSAHKREGALDSRALGGSSQQDLIRNLVIERTEKRFSKVLNPQDGDVTVIVSREKNNWLMLEMTVKAFGDQFFGEDKVIETGTNLDQLIDGVLDKIERQLMKKKDMLKERWKARTS